MNTGALALAIPRAPGAFGPLAKWAQGITGGGAQPKTDQQKTLEVLKQIEENTGVIANGGFGALAESTLGLGRTGRVARNLADKIGGRA